MTSKSCPRGPCVLVGLSWSRFGTDVKCPVNGSGATNGCSLDGSYPRFYCLKYHTFYGLALLAATLPFGLSKWLVRFSLPVARICESLGIMTIRTYLLLLIGLAGAFPVFR